MTEDFLHYIWRSSLFYPLSLNDSGCNIEVISTGELNTDSGPDFFNARIKLGEIVLAGNIEIHINASDWYRHGHHHNKAYDSVILQLVLNKDAEVRRTSGEIIPTAELKFERRLIDNYKLLLHDEFWIACQPYIAEVDTILITNWLNSIAIRRLENKAELIRVLLFQNQNSWEETLYQQLARNFGFRLNGGVFEMLARSIPYRVLLRHRNNLFQIEALLFGQSGMLTGNDGDEYFRVLKREFQFLKRKYSLKPIELYLWKFLRLRPANFPTVRIAQFAALLHKSGPVFSSVIETPGIKGLNALFDVAASEYWDTHYIFNRKTRKIVKSLGPLSVRSILINTVVPVLYLYGKQRKRDEFCEHAINLLFEIPAEVNCITSGWKASGIIAGNAFYSQALLHQKSEYCKYRRCLDCGIGNSIITG
jgi:hypothetical protein